MRKMAVKCSHANRVIILGMLTWKLMQIAGRDPMRKAVEAMKECGGDNFRLLYMETKTTKAPQNDRICETGDSTRIHPWGNRNVL